MVLDRLGVLGSDVVLKHHTAAAASENVHAIRAEGERSDLVLGFGGGGEGGGGEVRSESRVDGESGGLALASRVPALHQAVGSSSREEREGSIERAHIRRLSEGGERRKEAALLEVEAVDVAGRTDHKQVARARFVRHIAADAGDAELVVRASTAVDFDIAVGVEEDHLAP